MLSAASEAPATRVAHPTSAGGPEGEAVVVEEAGCEPPVEPPPGPQPALPCNGLTAEPELLPTTQQVSSPSSSSQPRAHDAAAAAELQRLRCHLIAVEESYTQELLLAEEREKQLRTKLADCEQQIEHLEQQLQRNVAHEGLEERGLQTSRRDLEAALLQVSQLEDRVMHLTASNERLQLLLQQNRKDCEDKWQESESRVQAEKQRRQELEKRLKWQEERFAESTAALGAAGRLADQIDEKQTQIRSLQDEVAIREKEVQIVRKELQAAIAAQQGKLDKQLVKSVVLSYLCAPADKKLDVQRLLSRILDFDQQELQRVGLSTASRAPDSLATQFVRFLESESVAPVPQTSSQSVRQLAHSLLSTSLSGSRPDHPSVASPADQTHSSASTQ